MYLVKQQTFCKLQKETHCINGFFCIPLLRRFLKDARKRDGDTGCTSVLARRFCAILCEFEGRSRKIHYKFGNVHKFSKWCLIQAEDLLMESGLTF